MTSNIGSDIILQAQEFNDTVKQQIEKLLRQQFRPEFLNRIDEIVYFKMLSHQDVVRIAQLQVNELKERLKERNVAVTIPHEVMDKVALLGYEKEFGARPLKRAIQHYISVPISQYLLKNPGETSLKLVVKNDAIVVE